MDDLVERLRAKIFAYPAENQRLALAAQEAADRIEKLEAALRKVEKFLRGECGFEDADWPMDVVVDALQEGTDHDAARNVGANNDAG